MSALAEALVAAQRRSLATLEKAYVAGLIEAEPMTAALESCGITDAEQDVRGLTFDRASELIEALKGGKYDPAEWDVPF